MRSDDSFPWPPPPGTSTPPKWNGRNFEVGGESRRILAYETDQSHWSETLTELHESVAGADHPIDVASRRLAVASMRQLDRNRPVILDVGCSSGYVLDNLRRTLPHATLIGADFLPGPLATLAQRMPDIPILQFDLRKCPLPDASIDGITSLNVLEHIDDHQAALAEIYRILKPGGLAHIEVPAGSSLYDIYDEHLMHHRRYGRRDLVRIATGSGFEILQATHLGALLYPAFYLAKRLNQRKQTLSAVDKANFVAQQIRLSRGNPFFNLLLTIELSLGRIISYPCGIRCVVLVRK